MAREQHDREDLLREATALVERAEFQGPGLSAAVVIGFRRDGSGSLYVGQDLMLQFNPQLQLRRAYYQDQLIKAEHGRLVALHRRRTEQAVILQRQEVGDEQQDEFLQMAAQWIADLHERLRNGRLHVVGRVPADAVVEQRVAEWLDCLRKPPLRVAGGL
jgi:hypothetical protein